jgi:hypothetical protein
LASCSIHKGDPIVVVYSRGSLVDVVSCGTGWVVVELNPQHIEFGAENCITHVGFWKVTLRRTRNDIILRTFIDKLVCSEVLTKSLDAGNVTSLGILRCVFNIEIKTINVYFHGGIIVVVATVQRTDMSNFFIHPTGIVWTIGTPQPIGKVNSIGC